MSPAVLDSIERLVDRFEASEARAAVLVGYERYFSAGLALPLLVELERPAMQQFIERFGAVMLRVFRCPRPIVAAINGHAIAGGCVLALQCDWRVMVDAPEARIGLNETQLGVGLPSSVLEPLKLAVPPASLVPIAYEGLLFAPDGGAGARPRARAVRRRRARGAGDGAGARAGGGAATAVAQVKLGLRRAALETMARVAAEETERWLDTWFSPAARERLRGGGGQAASLMSAPKLEVARIAGAAPTLVFLHEGLGSLSAWRDFPAWLATATGRAALVYSRAGYGRSPLRPAPWPVEFMHEEARALGPLVGGEEAILVGHSDGASIALLYAAEHAVRGLVLEAPHVFVEDKTVASIARLDDDVRERLGRHHERRGAALRRLARGLAAPAVPPLEHRVGAGARARADAGDPGRRRRVRHARAGRRHPPPARRALPDALLPECGHAPHRDQPARTLAAMTAFVQSITSTSSGGGSA